MARTSKFHGKWNQGKNWRLLFIFFKLQQLQYYVWCIKNIFTMVRVITCFFFSLCFRLLWLDRSHWWQEVTWLHIRTNLPYRHQNNTPIDKSSSKIGMFQISKIIVYAYRMSMYAHTWHHCPGNQLWWLAKKIFYKFYNKIFCYFAFLFFQRPPYR